MIKTANIACIVFLLVFLPVIGQLRAQDGTTLTAEQETSIRAEIERQVVAGELVLPIDLTLAAAQDTTVGVIRLLLHVAAQPTLGERLLTGTFFWTAAAKAMVAADLDPTATPPPDDPPPPPPSSTVTVLVVSVTPDRLSPLVMNGATVSGTIYAFVVPEVSVQQVEFFLDGSTSLFQRERRAPYDLAGTESNRLARPFDTTGLANASHSIRLVVQLSDGTAEEYTVRYEVAN